MIKGIAHAAVTVKDMEESLRFYTLALGFQNAFEILPPETENLGTSTSVFVPADSWSCSMAEVVN